MVIKKADLIEKIKYNLISIIILMNSFQLVLSWNFNISFNMWIEYGLIFLVLLFSKFKIKNIKNVIIICISILLFSISMILLNTPTLKYYVNQFELCALPLLLIFLIDIDIKKFMKVFYIYNIINIFLYLLFLFVFSNGIIEDYMTFGYYSMFSISYIIVYAFYNKYYKTTIIAFVIVPLIIINGNRGTILIVGMLIFSMLLISSKMNIIKKLLIFAVIMIFIFNVSSIAKFLLDFLVETFDVEKTYSITNLYNMLDSQGVEGIFGSRYYIYEEALNEIKQHPILGLGIAGFHDKYGYFPHNIFLDVYSTFGIIIGTIYMAYIFVLGVKLHIISKENIQVRILFIFMLANIMKLLLSKTFIYDPVIWLYIALGNLICTKYKEILNEEKIKIEQDKGENDATNNNIYTDI